jgi:hypothetical protein
LLGEVHKIQRIHYFVLESAFVVLQDTSAQVVNGPRNWGSGFMPGMIVKLVREGHPDIAGDVIQITQAGRRMSVRFDLNGAAHGLSRWAVVYTARRGHLVDTPP